jgi:ABC-type glycerol-3-phosphate transport system substrate-binding protein
MFVLTAAFLFFSMTVFTACAQSADSPMESGGLTETAATEETQEPRIYPSLPDVKYDGTEIRIAMHPVGGTDWQDWLSRDIDTDAPNGEVINDAVYARNLAVEEKYDVKITGIENTDMNVAVQKQVKAGTDDFHIVTPRIESIKGSVRSGYFVNLYDLENVDLTKPWYDQMMIDNATILGQLYYVTGDMIILDDDSTSAMVFNKKIITS